MASSTASRSTKNPRKPKRRGFRGRRSERPKQPKSLSLLLRIDLQHPKHFLICRFISGLGKAVTKLGSKDRHVFWRINAETNLASSDLDHRHRDPGADVNFLP